ncbi:MAG: hypothetical protein M3Y13_04915 [Armatimonadota bacterium]|nr:hypothetical protein [Armatimonadota bacterium]
MQDQQITKKAPRGASLPRLCAGLTVGLLLAAAGQAGAQSSMTAAQKMKMQKLKAMTPAKGYLKAHKTNQNPRELLGGPISVQISQMSGPAYVALPSRR